MTKMLMDILLARRFFVFIRILFSTWKSSIFSTATIVLLISIIDQIATYFVGVLPSHFHISLSKKNEAEFDNLIFMCIGIVLFKALSFSLIKFTSYLLYLKCREKLCFILNRLYFKRHAFYRLNNCLDNPDQRMTQDVEKVTRLFSCELLSPLILSPFLIIFYTYLTYKSSGILGPFTIYFFFLTATIVNKMLISPMISLIAQQEQKEEDFRARHMEVRTNVESIAFYQSGFTENVFTNQKLNSLLKTQKYLIKKQFWLNFATNSFDFFGGILSYVILAISIFVQHKYADKSTTDLNGIISEVVGEFGGVTHRVIELYEELNRLHDDRLEIERSPSTVPSSVVALASSDETSKNSLVGCVSRKTTDNNVVNDRIKRIEALHGKQTYNIISTDSDIEEAEYLLGDLSGFSGTINGPLIDDGIAITIDSATITYPEDQTRALITNLSLKICQGKNVLITGESGVGKTTLLKAMAGLWNCVTGKIERHWRLLSNNMIFLPQKPYFSNGGISLRQQLVYPSKAFPVEKDVARLSQILEWLQIEHLFERCNGFDSSVNWDWNETLLPGELQKLSIGRVLYHRPRIAFLDEATSALSFENEIFLYKLLQNESITCVSVGHRSSLKQFHDVELHLSGRGGFWTLLDLETQSLSSQD